MRKERKIIARIGEEYEELILECGMRVLLIKKDFNTSYGLLCVPFGSLHEDGYAGDEHIVLPDGIAHFLEHKLFENPDGVDTFVRFSSCGADTNAYTTYNRTCYLFSTTESTEQALDILLESVFTPYFTDRNVKKEKGIILQELRMYRDDQGDRISNAMMAAMYKNCRVRVDVCGSVKSVKSITKEDLYRAYNAYYKKENMTLVLCGRFDDDKVREVLKKYDGESGAAPCAYIPTARGKEPVKARKKNATFYTGITTPVISLGIKGPACDVITDPAARAKYFYVMCALGYALFSPGCPFVAGLIKDNLLPGESSYDVVCSDDYTHIVFEAPCYQPEEVKKRFLAACGSVAEKGVSPESFGRAKKMLYAEILDAFNSCEGIAHFYLGDLLDGIDSREKIEALEKLAGSDLLETAKTLLRRENITAMTSLPLDRKPQKKGANL